MSPAKDGKQKRKRKKNKNGSKSGPWPSLSLPRPGPATANMAPPMDDGREGCGVTAYHQVVVCSTKQGGQRRRLPSRAAAAACALAALVLVAWGGARQQRRRSSSTLEQEWLLVPVGDVGAAPQRRRQQVQLLRLRQQALSGKPVPEHIGGARCTPGVMPGPGQSCFTPRGLLFVGAPAPRRTSLFGQDGNPDNLPGFMADMPGFDAQATMDSMPDPNHRCVDQGGNDLRVEVCRKEMDDMYQRPGHHDGADGSGPAPIKQEYPIGVEAEKIVGINKDPFDFGRKAAAAPPPSPDSYFPSIDYDDPERDKKTAEQDDSYAAATSTSQSPDGGSYEGTDCDSLADLDAWFECEDQKRAALDSQPMPTYVPPDPPPPDIEVGPAIDHSKVDCDSITDNLEEWFECENKRREELEKAAPQPPP